MPLFRMVMCNLVYHIFECAHHSLNKTGTLRVPRGVKPGTASETIEKLSIEFTGKIRSIIARYRARDLRYHSKL